MVVWQPIGRVLVLTFCLMTASLVLADPCETGLEPECFCQFADQFPYGGEGEVASVHVSSTCYQGASLTLADGFLLVDDQTLVNVSWWGSTAQAGTSQACVRSSLEFSLTIFENDGGAPGAVVESFSLSSGGALVIEETGETVTLNGSALLPEYRYYFTLPEPLPLPAGQYWLEIVETVFDFSCFWVWEKGPPGDSQVLWDFYSSGYDPDTLKNFDMAWCLEFDVLTDCNQNGIPDAQDIADETSHDCDENGIPDECEYVEHLPAFINNLLIPVGDQCVLVVCMHDQDGNAQLDGRDIQGVVTAIVAYGTGN